ncbi:DUF4271 domain-containing protein [Parabacteroides sp. PF5-9]|uniref:DUF4271 domain-containing protein n=1 Tax=Parabacteroides sp. PF5-9 TaxID=1742404 RepID=UPI0024741024|nr:DUF4271 domain-containing protein [Parabacteroides sp. PF5-9]MDH6356338.1 ABC-type multidrug transport system fused ATPase/permease subunit [Parabacteroides sp. PF5-9]
MNVFEGYTGIHIWEGQWIDDMIFSLLLALLLSFALAFRLNYQLFLKMLKDIVSLKKRQNLFELPAGRSTGSEWGFKHFMSLQTLLLCSICLFLFARNEGLFPAQSERFIFLYLGLIFFVLIVFYWLKRGMYALIGFIFFKDEEIRLWYNSFQAVFHSWGVLLYLPVFWMAFSGSFRYGPVILFVILYFLWRFVIIFKSIRIFHTQTHGVLYLILYLCGQEILPLYLLYKGIVYLYNFSEVIILWR